MIKISNIPQEIYAVALDNMYKDRPKDGDHEATYWEIVNRRAWTANELEQATSDYLLRKGSFADDQEFESLSGYELGKGD